MKAEILKNEEVGDFIDYCKQFRKRLDDSFLYDEDLMKFQPNDENPTYIIRDSDNNITAAASLIIDDYNKRGKKGRFRIFYSKNNDIECYKLLLNSTLKHTDGLNKIFLFIPLINEEHIKSIKDTGFEVERYSFLLIRDKQEISEPNFPDGYEVRTFRPGADEETWCDIRNEAFKNLQGSETPMTPDMVKNMLSERDYIEGGLMILYHGEMPIGVIRGAADEYNGVDVMYIGPLAILPEFQRKGLGRNLLRTSLCFARGHGYDNVLLCVNAENERAKALYLQEGFRQAEAVACYKYELG